MPSWQGKSKGNRLGYQIFVFILRKGGVQPAYALLRIVCLFYLSFSFRSTKIILDLFHNRLRFGFFSSLCKIYRNYYLFGQSIVDKVILFSGLPNTFSFDFDGEEHLRQMVRDGRGGLLLSAHIGNWEIAGHLLKRLDTRIHIVMYDGEHQQIKEYLAGVMGRQHAQIILIKNDLSHIFQIDEAFKNNELVCMHADRFITGNKTLSAPFLSEKAQFPAGPFLLATKYRVPLSFVFAVKERNLHYHFYASEPRSYRSAERVKNMEEMLHDYANAMEMKLKQYPEQWYNYYDFWNHE